MDHDHDHDDAHDRGLAFDLSTMARLGRPLVVAPPAMDRRGALKLLGGLGLLALAGCGSDGSTATGASSGSTT